MAYNSMYSPISQKFPFGMSPTANNTGGSMPGSAPLPKRAMGDRLMAQGTNSLTYGPTGPYSPLAPRPPLPTGTYQPPLPASLDPNLARGPQPGVKPPGMEDINLGVQQQIMQNQQPQMTTTTTQPNPETLIQANKPVEGSTWEPAGTQTTPQTSGYTPVALRQQIGGDLMSLLQGENKAADIADRRASSQLNQMQKTGDAGLARQAAAMGISPSDPRYQTFLNQNQAAQQSFGSRVLGENAQRRLEDQTKNLTTATAFNLGQQTHDLNTDKFGEEKKQGDVNNLFDIINNENSSIAQVEGAKAALYSKMPGLDPAALGIKDPVKAVARRNEIMNDVKAAFPGLTQDQYDKMVNDRMQSLDKSTYGAFPTANTLTNPGAGGGGGGSSFGEKTINGIVDVGGDVGGYVGRGMMNNVINPAGTLGGRLFRGTKSFFS